jgi:hypothetical protein
MNQADAQARRWFQERGGEKVGPLSFEQLRALALAGQLRPADLLLPEGASRWIPAAEMPALFAPSDTPTVDGAPATGAPAGQATVLVGPTEPARATSPATVPGYEVLGELGHGGMGVVYKARQTKLGRLVALKMIRSGEHAGHAERERFQVEAEAIAGLRHPNIVQIHEIGEPNGQRRKTVRDGLSVCRALTFTADGKSLLGGYENGTVGLEALSPAEKSQVVSVGNKPVTCLALAPNGKRLARPLDLAAESQRLQAAAQRRLAERQREDGENGAAIASLREATGLLDTLTRQHPDEPDFQREQAHTLQGLAEALRETSPAEAEACCRRGLALVDRKGALFLPGPESVLLHMRMLRTLVAVLLATDRLKEAESVGGQLQEVRSRLQSLPADDPGTIERLHTARQMNVLFQRLGKKEKARRESRHELTLLKVLQSARGKDDAYWREMIEALDRLARLLGDLSSEQLGIQQWLVAVMQRRCLTAPDDPARYEQLARVARKLGGAFEQKGVKGADHYYYLAWTSWASLQRLQPQRCEPWSEAAEAAERIAHLQRRAADFQQARVGVERAIDWQETARRKAPDNPRCRERLASHLDLLAEACLRLGEHAQSAAAIRRGLPIVAETPVRCRRAAGLLAGCAGQAQRDSTLKPEEQKAKRDEYAAEAMRQLETAVRLGLRDTADLEKSPELATLRNRDDFKRLLLTLRWLAFPLVRG